MTGPQQSHDGYNHAKNQGHYDDQSPDYRDDYAPAALDENGKFSYGAIVVMLVFAVLATILMLFTNSQTWTKIAVLCALWAAIVGCIAVSRLRKQVDNQQRDNDNLERLHQAELERELATHREQELILEQNFYDSLQEQEQNILADIRAELTVLRENLSAMIGTDLDTERAALKAEAERILELERDSKDSSAVEARTNGSTSRTSSGAASSRESRNTVTSNSGNKIREVASPPPSSSTSKQGDNSLRTGSFNAVKWTPQSPQRSGTGYSADETTVLSSVEKNNSSAGGTRPPATQSSSSDQSSTSGSTQHQGSAVYRGADRDNSQFFAFGAGPAQDADKTTDGQASSRVQDTGAPSTSESRRRPDPYTGSFASFGSGRSVAPSYDRTHAPTTGGFRAQSAASGSSSTNHQPRTGMFTGPATSGGSSPYSTASADARGRHEGAGGAEARGHRRRADESAANQNVTVAALLEQLKKNSEN